jgi:hypothetical protein
MLANWEERVTLSGAFHPASKSLAVVESDCSGSEPWPQALHAYGASGALDRLTKLIEETPPIGLDEVQIDIVAPGAADDDTSILARLIRPNAELLISRSNRP